MDVRWTGAAADEHEVLVQDFDRRGAYDVTWATHALYALPPDELAEGVARMVAALRSAGADVGVQVLRYRTGSPDRTVVEGSLQRCAFDDTVSLEQMETREPLAGYLAGCRAADGSYEFRHEAHLMTWEQGA